MLSIIDKVETEKRKFYTQHKETDRIFHLRIKKYKHTTEMLKKESTRSYQRLIHFFFSFFFFWVGGEGSSGVGNSDGTKCSENIPSSLDR